MGGLLYKDFLSVKGKKISIIILVLTLAFLILRLLLPGGDIDMADAATQTDAGLYDFFLWTFPAMFVFCSLGLPSIWTKSLISNDEKSKIKAFTSEALAKTIRNDLSASTRSVIWFLPALQL